MGCSVEKQAEGTHHVACHRVVPPLVGVSACRGLAAVLFGVLAIAWPGLTLTVLVLFWGAYALVDGVLALAAAMRTLHDQRWGLVLEGVAGVGAGLVNFFYPDLTALVLVYIIAAWAVITGVLELFVEAQRLAENRQHTQVEPEHLLAALIDQENGVVAGPRQARHLASAGQPATGTLNGFARATTPGQQVYGIATFSANIRSRPAGSRPTQG